MFCTRCGSEIAAGSAFCPKCGTPAGAAAPAAARVAPSAPRATGPLQRPGIVTLLAVLHFIGACFWLCVGLVMMLGMGWAGADAGGVGAAGIGVAATAFVLIGVLQLACGIGLWQLKPYGRVLQLVFAGIGLLGFPIGTVIAILMFVYFLKPEVKLLFAGRPAEEMTAEEQTLVATTQNSQTALIVTLVVLVVGGVLVLPIIAAIAVPGFLRARTSGNEASAIGSLRAVQSAEAAYSASTGRYGSLECLITPASCGATGSTEPFLPSSFSESERSGYRFELHASQDGTAFVYVAIPVNFGATGTRSFCDDAEGALCSVTSAVLDVTGDKCPSRSECQPIGR